MKVKKLTGIPTIDVEMAIYRFKNGDVEDAFAIDTASKVAVEPQVETTDAIQNIKASSGRLIAQKPKTDTITGHQITHTDNVFLPELVVLLQGGTYTKNADGTATYTPPVSGSTDKGKVFTAEYYSAIYDASGEITGYQKITYPNCKGSPITVNMEDNVFFVPEYTIMSAPKRGQAAYQMDWIKELPEVEEEEEGGGTEPPVSGGEQGGENTGGTEEPQSRSLMRRKTADLKI